MSEETSMVDAEGNYHVDNPMEPQEPTISLTGTEESVETQMQLDDFDDDLHRGNDSSKPLVTDIEPVNQEGVEPKDDESRYQYWQSKHDQKASEATAMADRLQELENIAPIANYIKQNPEALQSVAGHLSGNPQTVPAQAESDGSPKKPERPNKPASFDASEAYMDPESDSYKYQQNVDSYRDDMIDYYGKMDDYRQDQDRIAQQQYQKQQAQAQQQNYYNGVHNDLINKHGYAPEKADEFMKFYSSPDSLSLDNLVKLDKLRNAPTQEQVALKQRANEMNRSNERVKVPAPAGIAAGQAPPQMNDEDQFNAALLGNKR